MSHAGGDLGTLLPLNQCLAEAVRVSITDRAHLAQVFSCSQEGISKYARCPQEKHNARSHLSQECRIQLVVLLSHGRSFDMPVLCKRIHFDHCIYNMTFPTSCRIVKSLHPLEKQHHKPHAGYG